MKNLLGEKVESIIETAAVVSASQSLMATMGTGALIDPAERRPSDVITIDDRQFRRHDNGGGLVEVTAYAAPSVFVGPNARIQDHAVVLGQVQVRDRAVVDGYAFVADRCIITKQSRIGGYAVLRDHVWTRHSARVDGRAVLLGAITVEYTRHINAGTFIGTMGIS